MMTKVDALCEFCHLPFTPYSRDVKRGKGRFCSRSCRSKAMVRDHSKDGNPHWKGGKSKTERTREYAKAFPERYRAQNFLHNALRSGIIVRLPCEVCGEVKSEGHHHDYSKPSEITWLCHYHHRVAHGKGKISFIANGLAV